MTRSDGAGQPRDSYESIRCAFIAHASGLHGRPKWWIISDRTREIMAYSGMNRTGNPYVSDVTTESSRGSTMDTGRSGATLRGCRLILGTIGEGRGG